MFIKFRGNQSLTNILRNGNKAVKDYPDRILGDKTKIARLSETRWSARSDSFSDVKRGIFPIVTSLKRLEEDGNEKANGLLASILQFYFIVSLVLLASVLAVTCTHSHKLQYKGLELNDASENTRLTKISNSVLN